MSSEPGAPTVEPLTRTAIPAEESTLPVITRAVSAVTNAPTDELPPLFDAVDPDAVDALVDSTAFTGWITFEYADHAVRVESDGSVAVFDELPEH